MLHRLPNGEWIRLADVTAITPHEKVYEDHDRNQVIVSYGAVISQLPFDTFVAAQAYADELAALVNEAKSDE